MMLLWAALLLAQEGGLGTDPERDETVRLTLSGSVVLDGVWRSGSLTDARGSFATPSAAARETQQVEGEVQLRLLAQILDVAEVGFLLRNERLGGDALLGDGNDGLAVVLKEAWIRLPRFLDDRLSLTAGTPRYAWDVRGTGQSLFFDPLNSESLLADINSPVPVSLIDSLQPAGVLGSWREESVSLDVALYPAIIEGGAADDDEWAYLAAYVHEIARRSRLGAIASFNGVATHRSRMFTFGASGVWREWEGVELFGEGYFQIGDRRDIILSGQATGLDGAAYAFHGGIRAESRLGWLELGFTWLGNDHDVTDGTERRFLSYESVRDLLIVEDPVTGLDLDTNTRTLKLLAGMRPDPRWTVSAAVASVRLNAATPYIPTALGRSADVGIEVDGRIAWEVSRQVRVRAEGGLLVGSRLLRAMTAEGEDHAWVAVFGVDASF